MAFPALESEAPEDKQSPLSQDRSIDRGVRDDPSCMVAHDCPLREKKTVLYQDCNSQVAFTTVTTLYKPHLHFF